MTSALGAQHYGQRQRGFVAGGDDVEEFLAASCNRPCRM